MIHAAPAYPRRLMQVHAWAMYTAAGWSRIFEPAWYEGDALYVALASLMFGRLPVDWTPLVPLLKVGGYYAFVVEPLASILLIPRATRRFMALALLAMHVGIEVSATVGFWNVAMTCALLTFLPDRWLARGFSRFGRSPPSEP